MIKKNKKVISRKIGKKKKTGKKAAEKRPRLVVKRRGHIEPYDEKKVYASCYAAALNCHYSEIQSEKIASEVMKKISDWVKRRTVVISDEIRQQIIESLADQDVALMYKHHLDLS